MIRTLFAAMWRRVLRPRGVGNIVGAGCFAADGTFVHLRHTGLLVVAPRGLIWRYEVRCGDVRRWGHAVSKIRAMEHGYHVAARLDRLAVQ